MEPKFKTKEEIVDSQILFKGRDIVSMSDFSREEIDYVLDVADWFKRTHEEGRREELEKILDGIAVASVFAEASTRTRCSFEAAAKVLEAEILAINDPKASSFAKGEPLQDALRVMEGYVLQMGYGSAIAVMRHNLDGAARFAADVLKIPFLNGGDGKCRHPTQAFLDLYSIRETQGKIDGLKVAMVGDLKHGRTVHSLSNALSKYKDVTLYFVSPEVLQMPAHTIEMLKERGARFETRDNIEGVVSEVDILYMTRIQKERFKDPAEYDKVKDVFKLNAAMLKGAKPNMRVLHPLPRYKFALEIAFDVDKTPHAYYFEQALNGLFAREALFSLCTGRVGNDMCAPPRPHRFVEADACPNDNCISRPDHYEGAEPKFHDLGKGKYQCHYCETRFEVRK
jgi:aspartate carbamoyltransferase catalytic subunit